MAWRTAGYKTAYPLPQKSGKISLMAHRPLDSTKGELLMKKRSVQIAFLVASLLWLGAYLAQAYAQAARRTGEITKIDSERKSFVVKTARGEWNILTTDKTVFKEGDKEIKFEDLKVGDSVRVTGERKGNDVEASEVIREAKKATVS